MFMADPPEKIQAARMLTLYYALKLEINTGLKRSSSGRATGTLIREATGLNARRKAALLSSFDLWLKRRGIRECAHNITEAGIGHDAATGEDAGPVGYCDQCDGWHKGTFVKDASGKVVGFTVGR